MNKKIRIVADSSSDVLQLTQIPFQSAPLKIITGPKEYIDDEMLDVQSMVDDLQSYKGRSSTSCPNTDDWLQAFDDAEEIYCITITGTLSGSYASAMIAKNDYEEQYPNRRVFVLNSLTAGPEIALCIDTLQELILSGKDFDTICQQITTYIQNTGLLFMLKSMKNLANNGRVSPMVAKMAGLLGICVVGKASAQGDLEPLHKCRGEQKSLQAIVKHMKDAGLSSGRVKISHCCNENAANKLKAMLENTLPDVQTDIYPCRGLCSFYAEKGGMLIGFEKM